MPIAPPVRNPVLQGKPGIIPIALIEHHAPHFPWSDPNQVYYRIIYDRHVWRAGTSEGKS